MRLSTYISLKLGRVKIFRQNKNWLAYKTLSILKTRHPEIFKTSLKDKINYYINILSKGDKWWIIVLGILLFFCFGLINIPPLNILKITPETAYDLVRQRTANMAMIISITLVVVGYILNTLSDKSTLVFDLLLEETRLYPIIYLNLTLIGVFFIISSLRDTIPSDIFTRLTLSGTYLAVFLLFLFGWLFAKVFFYSKKENIRKMLKEEFLRESLEELKKDMIKEESSRIFQELAEKVNIEVVDSVRFTRTLYSSFGWLNSEWMNLMERYKNVRDVHLKLISEGLHIKKEKSIQIKLRRIGIGYPFYNDSVLLESDSTPYNEMSLKKFIVLSNPLKVKDEKEDAKVFLRKRLMYFVKERNLDEFEYFRDCYLKLFELQLKYYKEGDVLTYGLWREFRQFFLLINKNKDEDLFFVVRSLVKKIISLSIEYKSLDTFKEFVFVFPMMYHLSFDDKDDDSVSFKFYRNCSEVVPSILKDLIDLYISSTFINSDNSLKELKLKNEFIYHTYKNFAQLLYYMVRRGDEARFEYAVNEFNKLEKFPYNESANNESTHLGEPLDSKNQMIENEKRKPSSYYRHVLLGIRYWAVFLFRVNQIDDKTFFSFFHKTNIYFSFGESEATDVIFLKNRFHYLGISEWDYVERHPGIVYTPPDHTRWLVFGLFVDMVIKNNSFSLSRIPVANITVIENLYGVFQQAHIEIERKFDYWKEALRVRDKGILRAIDIEEYQKRVNRLFAEIKQRIKIESRKEREKIVGAELDTDKIDNYRAIIGEAWDKNARIRRLFDYFDASEEVLSKETKLIRIGHPESLKIIKENFIKDGVPLYGLENWGWELAEWENNFFFSEVFNYFNSGIEKITEIGLIKTLNVSISDFKKKGKSPNFIFLSDRYKYNNALLENSNFVGEQKIFEKEKKEVYPVNFIGTYKEIPIFSFRMIGHANSLIVGNFEEAFTMLYTKIEDGYNDLLKVAFREINDEEAHEIFDGKPEAWKSYNGQILSEEEALLLIKTSLYIDIHTILKFEIKDNEAIIIGTFKN